MRNYIIQRLYMAVTMQKHSQKPKERNAYAMAK